MMSYETTDILVVGLGPAGSRAAASVARMGYSIIALDRRRRAGHPVQCAEFVPAMIGQELTRLGAVSRQPIYAMETFVEDQPPDVKGDFPGRMIDRAAFDRALVERAIQAGADCRFGVQVDGLMESGRVRHSKGGEIRARLIIGADGPRSPVGRSIASVNRELVETRQVAVPLNIAHQATDIFLSAEFRGGYGWLFPKGKVANLGIGVIPAAKYRLKPLLRALHHRLVAQGRVSAKILSYTGGAIPVGGLRPTQGRLGEVPILLAGDAAGLANPITGAGINAAVISGDMAGCAAAEWLGGEETALDDYEKEIVDLFKSALDRAVRHRREILQSYETGTGPSAAALRRGWVAYPEYWAA